MRWYNQLLGLFGFHSSDQYGDSLRTSSSIAGNAGACGLGTCGIMSGAQVANSSTRMGPDFTLSLLPFGVPLSLDNQFMFNKESNPTGFGQEFKWKGGFHQLNWQISKTSAAYARYDWLHASAFDDTGFNVNGVAGITRSTPKEYDYVVGVQHLYDQNIKLVAEYRHHVFNDGASGAVIPALGVATTPAQLSDNGITLRAMFGF